MIVAEHAAKSYRIAAQIAILQNARIAKVATVLISAVISAANNTVYVTLRQKDYFLR
jgi:hypothetical protein